MPNNLTGATNKALKPLSKEYRHDEESDIEENPKNTIDPSFCLVTTCNQLRNAAPRWLNAAEAANPNIAFPAHDHFTRFVSLL